MMSKSGEKYMMFIRALVLVEKKYVVLIVLNQLYYVQPIRLFTIHIGEKKTIVSIISDNAGL